MYELGLNHICTFLSNQPNTEHYKFIKIIGPGYSSIYFCKFIVVSITTSVRFICGDLQL